MYIRKKRIRAAGLRLKQIFAGASVLLGVPARLIAARPSLAALDSNQLLAAADAYMCCCWTSSSVGVGTRANKPDQRNAGVCQHHKRETITMQRDLIWFEDVETL